MARLVSQTNPEPSAGLRNDPPPDRYPGSRLCSVCNRQIRTTLDKGYAHRSPGDSLREEP